MEPRLRRKQQRKLEFGKRGRDEVEQVERKPTSIERLKRIASRWLGKKS